MASGLKHGIVMPVEDALDAVDLAVAAEQAGWDGFFMADIMWSLDTWSCLSAAAVRTERIRLGTLLSPPAVMRPWKLASQVGTLDHLSKGRAILTVGMGAPDVGFEQYGETTDLKKRAELVDESLEIIEQLWRGGPFKHAGKHYQLDVQPTSFGVPKPVQQPRVPIWVVGAWPRPKSMARALRWDGLTPYVVPKDGPARLAEPDDLRAMRDWIQTQRKATTPFDMVIEGRTMGDDPAAAKAVLQPWIDAGMTWWIESLWQAGREEMLTRLRQGPARVD